jgi:hypothetical protein
MTQDQLTDKLHALCEASRLSLRKKLAALRAALTRVQMNVTPRPAPQTITSSDFNEVTIIVNGEAQAKASGPSPVLSLLQSLVDEMERREESETRNL